MRLLVLVVSAGLALVGCRSPEAGIELTLESDPSLGVDELVITLSSDGAEPVEVRAPDPPAQLAAEETLGLIVKRPGLIGAEVTLTVVGLSAEIEVALGQTRVTTTDGETARARVTLARSYACGDGKVHAREACDDGDGASGDGCSSGCGVEPGYACAGEPSVCLRCGDGEISDDEECDDGNSASDDGCSASCQLEAGFTCGGAPSACTTVCGDGIVVGAEACDDGGEGDGDGCSSSCAVEAGFACEGAPSVCTTVCGDGVLAGAEACDDGGQGAGDGCDEGCLREDGWTCAGEPSACVAVCGDELLVGAEECDEGAGNSDTAPDACRTTCLLPHCGDVVSDTGEGCDDGNLDNGDGCLTGCRLPSCGDGFLAAGEGCDDGNLISGDGCSACVVDVSHLCGGVPSVCALLPDSHVVDASGGGDFTTVGAAIAAAVDGDTLFVRAGVYDEALYVNGTDLTLVADGEVVVETSAASPTLRARAALVVVHGLTLRHTGSGQPVVRSENPQGGASFTFVGATLGPSGGVGVVTASNGAVELHRTLVTGNSGGGLDLNGAYLVESSALVDNGAPASAIGAASLALAGTFRFSTVSGNQASGPALSCSAATPIEASIVYGNASTLPLSASCDGSSSLTADPLFDDDGYHLAPGSPAREAGPAAGCPARDIDGDARPMGAACALGADERP